MGLTYTRAEIRRRVNENTRGSDTGLVLAAVTNRQIADIHRDFVERTKCNRNTVIFSLADGVTDGTLEYDMRENDRLDGNAPTLVYADYEGYPSYKLSNCDAIVKIERYVSTDDGSNVEMVPVDSEDINRLNLLSGTYAYPQYYEMLGEQDTFRVFRALPTTSYPIKYRIWYMESVIDLISDDASPNDTDDPTMTSRVGDPLLDDMNVESAGTLAAYYTFAIDAAAAPDTFAWTKNGAGGAAGVNCSTSAVAIEDGLEVSWDANTGHTVGDTWTVYQDDPQIGSIPLRFRKAIVYGATALVFAIRRDVDGFNLYNGLYEREVQRCRAEVYTDQYAKPTRIKVDRRTGQGG